MHAGGTGPIRVAPGPSGWHRARRGGTNSGSHVLSAYSRPGAGSRPLPRGPRLLSLQPHRSRAGGLPPSRLADEETS